MRIGYFSSTNPFTDRYSWSGTIYKIREAIEESGHEVVWINTSKFNFCVKLIRSIGKIFFFNKCQTWTHTPIVQWLTAKGIDNKLCSSCDSYFFPGCAFLTKYLKIKKPVFYLSDANYCDMLGYYWHNVPKYFIKRGNSLEQYAIDNSDILIRSSRWSAESAITNYHSNPDKVFEIPFGANIEDSCIVHSKPYKDGTVKLLFCGVEWDRKGGNIAVETAGLLNQRGISTVLMIMGIKELPIEYDGLPYIENYGFLNKNNPDEYRLYLNVWSSAHLFILPTQAECAGIVFSEASAYGIPIVTYDTGGVSSYVLNGVNGYMLTPCSTAEVFATCIERIVNNNEFYSLSEGGKNIYQTKLSWKQWSKSFASISNTIK